METGTVLERGGTPESIALKASGMISRKENLERAHKILTQKTAI